MTSESLLIIKNEEAQKKLQRIAYQIYENHLDSKHIIIAGIASRGYALAAMISDILKSISSLECSLAKITLDKRNPSENNVTLDIDLDHLDRDVNVVIVDDVLNTGRTLVYGILPFLKADAISIQTCVLVDRNHKLFPISADYTGMSLATTLQEHVSVNIEANEINVFLS